MRICIDLFPFGAGGGCGVKTFCQWIVDIPRRVQTPHQFTVLLNPSNPMVSRRLEPGEAFDPFVVPEASLKSPTHPLRKAYSSRLVPEALRRVWRSFRKRMWSHELAAPVARRAWLENGGFDVIHCPYQVMDPAPPDHARVPYCINIHDLQHEHMPGFFSLHEMAYRREYFKKAADIAAGICVIADHVKADIVHYLGVRPEKVHVIWPGPPFQGLAPVGDAERAEVRQRLALPDRFLLYPAITWQHKNHLRLLQALAQVRQRCRHRIPLVLSGTPGPYRPAVLAEAARLGLEDQVRWLGCVAYGDLRRIYALAEATVVPTLYEASSGPVYEAMAMGCPVACSTVANLPWLVDDGRAGLLFDPLSVDAIADALERLWEDDELRRRLAAAGPERVRAFSWESFGRGYLAAYERAAGI